MRLSWIGAGGRHYCDGAFDRTAVEQPVTTMAVPIMINSVPTTFRACIWRGTDKTVDFNQQCKPK